MDPEPEMIVEAREKSDDGGITNIEWLEAGSDDLEDLREEIGELNLVTIGTAFHWMDRDATLQCLASMLSANGAVVEAGTSGSKPTGWGKTAKAVIRKWLGETRRAGSGVYQVVNERHEAIFARSPFRRIERYRNEYEYLLRIAQSTSLLIKKIHLRKIFARPFMRSIRKANSTKPGLLTLLLHGRNLKNIANNALHLTGNSLALTASRWA
jgi:ubiquinone/menaquinone biosynthesis C-methylase UbiE